MNDKEIEDAKRRIDSMGAMEMARLRRFAPIGHPYFDTHLPLYEHFEKRFKSLGGFTPTISKAIGWQ